MKILLKLAESLGLRAESRTRLGGICGRHSALSALASPLSASLVVALALLAPAARAQWQTTTYTLKGGWNAIYLHGDATHASIDALLASHPEVVSVWRWNPNPSQIQFSTSSLIPVPGTPEWSVWTRGGTGNTLAALTGQTAYLVECSGSVANTYVVPIVQRVQPPRSTWVRNGANLLGFPSRLDTSYPSFTGYFATFPVATAVNSRIYKYVGGPLGAANPIQVFSPGSEELDRTRAYWFEAAVVSNFYAPVEVSPSNLEGLVYGRTGSLVTVRVRNRTSAALTLTAAPVDSAAAPVGQDPISGPVPLTYRTFNTAAAAYEFRAVTAANPVAVVVAPQSSVELTFGLDRGLMTGPADSVYASLLRFTDSGNLMDVLLPVSARVSSLAGLWVGEVAVTQVSNRTLARLHTVQVTRTAGSVVTTVLSRAVQSGATTLGAATLPSGSAGTLTYQWRKNDQAIAGATGANLALNPAEMTESGAFGSSVPKAFPLRVLLHVDHSGSARLLQQVFIGKLAATPHLLGLSTVESGLKADEKADAQRIVAAHLPPDAVLAAGSGSVALGQTLVRSFTLAHTAPTNPFVHTYHPDHDNRNARFEPAPLAAGVESPAVTRALSFTFAPSAPAGTSAAGWGSTVLGGTYTETVTGLHRHPVTAIGTFELRRVSEIGAITTN
jgi:hypothetical protein